MYKMLRILLFLSSIVLVRSEIQSTTVQVTFDTQTYNACQGDQVEVEWNGYHNIQEVSEASYSSCDPSGYIGSELVTYYNSGHKQIVDLPTVSGQTRYFICVAHCSSGSKFAISCPSTSTEAPTTAVPTTVAPTTVAPTEAPTTASPTEAATTASPTEVATTTEAPTSTTSTQAPTATSEPPTSTTTTKAPSNSDDTLLWSLVIGGIVAIIATGILLYFCCKEKKDGYSLLSMDARVKRSDFSNMC